MEKDRNRIKLRNGGNRRAELWLQLALVITGIAALITMPGRRGDVLLIPLGGTLAATVNLALANRARLVLAMPSIGGVVVSGDGLGMMVPMLRQGTLVIGVPPMLCGSPPSAGEDAA